MLQLTAQPLVLFPREELLRIVPDSHGTGHLECPTVFPSNDGSDPLFGFCTIWDRQAWVLSLKGWSPGTTLSFEQVRRFELPGFTGGMARCSFRGVHGAVVGNGRSLSFLDLAAGTTENLFGGQEFGGSDTRLNELYVANRGSLMVGTMHIPCSQTAGAVYGIRPDGKWQQQIGGCTVANGMWEYNNLFGQVDSPTQMGRCFKLNDNGDVGHAITPLFNLAPSAADAAFPYNRHTDVKWRGPDGVARTDRHLLVAVFNAGVVILFDLASGDVAGVIEVPAPCPTSVCVANIDAYGTTLPVAFITCSAETLAPATRQRIVNLSADDPWRKNLFATGVYYCVLPSDTQIVPQNEFVAAE